MADFDAPHVRDRIKLTGREDPWRNAKLSDTRPFLGAAQRDHQGDQDDDATTIQGR